jgi:hypothetical protein
MKLHMVVTLPSLHHSALQSLPSTYLNCHEQISSQIQIDVLLLCIHFFPSMRNTKELWFKTGTVTRTKDGRRYLRINQQDKAHHQMMLLSRTGSDSVLQNRQGILVDLFVGIYSKKLFPVWNWPTILKRILLD